MTPDHWERVKIIAGEAWARPAGERIAYVTAACEDDEGLARDVSLLVAAMQATAHRFESPFSWPAEPADMTTGRDGERLGPYELVGLIGAGGMGEVYKARDTRLERVVAIKVLPRRESTAFLSRDQMTREARAVAALNHPHICTLHDIGNDDGLDYLVMEYLEGETLATRLARGALPIAEALSYAEQIASALKEAHRAGIVHRDLKPGNVMLAVNASARSPQAKLLDFGLAKAAATDTPRGENPCPDTALDVTVSGQILGTVPYMAPERFERKSADTRTDIFAFGAVLFEMLTGRKAFDGANRTEVIAAALGTARPSASSLRRGVPPALDHIVRRCLERNPDDRYQSVQDLIVEVQAARRRFDARWQSISWALAAVVVALAVTLAIVATWAVRDARRDSPAPAPSIARLAASTGVLGAPALSPDGASVVFSWFGDEFTDPELVLLRIGSNSRVRLTHDPGADEWPTWSPDGNEVAFIRCGSGRCGIFTVSIAGHSERMLLELRDDRYHGLAWSPDGRSIAYAERQSAAEPYALFLLSLDTFGTRRITAPPPRGLGELRFAYSPDGEQLAVIRIGGSIGVHLLSLKTGTDTILLGGQMEWFGGVAWDASGHALIVSGYQQGVRRLWRLPLAGGGLQQIGVAGEDAYYPSISIRGDRLAFIRDFNDWDLWRLKLDNGQADALSAFPSSTRLDLDPAFSPDGQRLAFVSERGGTREVWISHADGSEATQLTMLAGPQAGKPSWSPDGRFLAFHANGIHVLSAGGGPHRSVASDGEMPTWSADGRWIYFRRNIAGQFHVWKVPAGGGTAVQAIPGGASAAHEGPQGDLFFARTDGGIWRRSVAGGQETPVVADLPVWLPGYWTVAGQGLYYVTEERQPNQSVFHLRFFDFARRRSSQVATLAGLLDAWVGGLTVSPDRRVVIYSQRAYRTSEVMLVDGFQ